MFLIQATKYLIFVTILFSFLSSFSQDDGGKRLRINRKNPVVKTRLSFSPIIGLYTNNKKHTQGTRQKMAFCISIKEEIRLDKKNQSFLFIGAEYLNHGVNFNSYYFYEDSLKLYNNNMRYRYSLSIQEINFPIQFKYSFQRENNAIFSSYLFGGYCYRWLIANKLNVTENGNELASTQTNLRFKIPAFGIYNNSFLSVGFGAQKNTPLKHNAVFAELQFRYGLSPMYFQEKYSASNLFINSHFLLLTVGIKL